MPEELTCIVCGKPITEGLYSHHQRLNVDIHGSCPKTDVLGEDVSLHAMLHAQVVNAHDTMCLITEMTRDDGTIVYMGTCSCDYAEQIRDDERSRIRADIVKRYAKARETGEAAYSYDALTEYKILEVIDGKEKR